MTHDEALRELVKIARKVDPKAVAGAFVASLGTKPGFWRAPLVALAAARAVPSHRLGATFQGGACKECGLSKKVELEELHEAGQCLPGELADALVALRALVAHGDEVPSPSRTDIARLQRLLALVPTLPGTAREGQLQKAMVAAKTCVGGKYDRRHVIETLGACGVLETPEHPGFTTKWTTYAARQDRPNARVECDPPIAFWTAAHGVNAANVARWFGHLGVKAPRTSKARASANVVAIAKHTASAAKSAARAARKTELEPGDAVAFAIGSRWIAAVVVDTSTDKGGTSPVIELCAWSGKAPPSKQDVARARAAGTKWGKEVIRSRALLHGLWTKDDPNGRWAFVASGLRPPSSKHLPDPFQGSPSFHRLDEIARLAKDAGLVR